MCTVLIQMILKVKRCLKVLLHKWTPLYLIWVKVLIANIILSLSSLSLQFYWDPTGGGIQSYTGILFIEIHSYKEIMYFSVSVCFESAHAS